MTIDAPPPPPVPTPQPRPSPASTVQAAGRVAEDIVGGLKTQPTILGIVVLNMLGVAAATWYLDRIARYATQENTVIFEMLRACIPRP